MFLSLVVSSFRWALGAVVPCQGILQALRVQGTTLIVWLLGLACHRGWYSVEMLSRVRHVAKFWHQTYGTPWDRLAVTLHFQLLGHMYRSGSLYISSAAQEAEILEEGASGLLRRARRGPDWTGPRRLITYLKSVGHSMEDAADKGHWQSL